ncbi:methionine ABC transporter ATP-binding protein [Agrococcus sp. TF02-05]|uniref:methionine ABC transporter ATP-binding protein n=1 Tax=Agrococcus sp. TF02-05 TaxID=2815211 RepID=UPI001AA0C082|nr:ATP-binding cassette domain-containing protein [Agrococcus sp. TF02-05]MBO1771067.1 ATP-binding cassette domain-containing protein [Agrococcus sp. TF02-05]
MITIDHVSRRFGDGPDAVVALDDVSIEVQRGEIFGVVGQSGAGKSTLLRTVNALERPDSGTVTVDGTVITGLEGQALRQARHKIGMVFQHFNLVGNRTVAQNVEFALEAVGVKGDERRRRALEMLDLVGLAHRADDRPAQLSGGQRQRVGIARALASQPDVLLSDEATSALDPETTRQILDLIKRLSGELGLTVLLITHEMDVVKRICDSAALMEQGRVVEQGALEQLIRTPGSRVAAELFPVGEAHYTPGHRIIDVTYTGLSADRPVIAQLSRDFGLDVSILGAALETIRGHQAGRTRLAVPGDASVALKVINRLTSQGVTAWEVHP